MNKEEIYLLLEDRMLGYLDYRDIPVLSNGEELVAISTSPHLVGRQMDARMSAVTGDLIYVRQSVLKKLHQASQLVASWHPTVTLEVVYGYRTLEIQTALFEEHKRDLRVTFSGTELELSMETHKRIAVPEVAGHPTGGAVDVQLIADGIPLDFGTHIWEFSKDSYTFSPFISRVGWDNRHMLRNAMLAAGFAPFDGEWWHFSFGDKEWAKYYAQPHACYEQLCRKSSVPFGS